ncbi:GntR family transcriptional regulator [Nocardioides sp. NPDC087217]|uniref:GntR family transcriptional regulator n=1 Tax=Nocardioides sp. NPDC087217 TaxID=3364335 RepID=UPI00380619ED
MISRDNATPLHEQVAEDIRQRVRDGEYEVGAKLPPLRELRETYGVAEVTVHNAIRELQREGVLVSSTGRGTYVNALPESRESTDDVDQLRRDVASLSSRVERLEKLVDRADSAGA